MSAELLQPAGSSVEPYLRQVAPLLQTYWNSVHEITNQNLVLQRKLPPAPDVTWIQTLEITIHINVPIVFQVVVDERQSSVRSRKPSGGRNTHVKSTEEALCLVELVSLYNHKLQDIVSLELQAIRELKDGESNLSRKVKKLTELKKNLDEFIPIVDKILVYYSAKSMGFITDCLPSVEDLKIVKEKVCKMTSHLKKDELSSLFAKYDAKFTTTDDHILCSILGLRDDFADRLFEMDVEMRMHQPSMYYIENFMEDEENEMMKTETVFETGREGLLRKLQQIGFTAERAKTVTDSIPDNLIDLQLPSFWGMRYLNFTLFHHPLLGNAPRYPLKADIKDTWFTEQILLTSRIEPEESEAFRENSWSVNMINVSTPEGQGSTLVRDFLEAARNDNEYQLLFHGTTHESAMSILGKGIDINMGRNRQDFSSGDGFYLSEDFDNAGEWGRGGRGAHSQAVVVFRVRKELLDPDKEDGWDLSGNESDWEQIIHLCRSGYGNMRLKKKLLKDVAFVRGPMCLNPLEVGTGNSLVGFGRRNIMMCIRSDEYAEKFGSIENIYCVIFC